jgi:hypothetical protein
MTVIIFGTSEGCPEGMITERRKSLWYGNESNILSGGFPNGWELCSWNGNESYGLF